MKLKDANIETNKNGFLKLKEGENKIRLVSEFGERTTHYKKGECLKDNCPFCKEERDLPKKEKTRRVSYMCHVIDRSDNEFKIAEFGPMIMEQLVSLASNSQYGFDVIPPYDITINRKGQGLATEYTVIADRGDTALTESEKEIISKLELPSVIIEKMVKKTIEKVGGVPEANESQEVEESNIDDIPF